MGLGTGLLARSAWPRIVGVTEPSAKPKPSPWRTKVDPVAAARYFAPLAELTTAEMDALIAEAKQAAEAALPKLLEPYETKVDAETLARVVG
jgi:hypothetical protein